MKNKLLWIFLLVGILGSALLYFLFFQAASLPSEALWAVLLVFGLLVGGVLGALVFKSVGTSSKVLTESSHTIAQSMRKVFKVVSAEGHFNEIYDYRESKKLFNFIPSIKKALVIVEAKVLVGYDFEKLQWELDPVSRKVRLKSFPAPEILSTETDYKYYNIEEQFFNLFSKEDLSRIQKQSKAQVIEAARKSELPKVAAEQMQMLLTELLSGKDYTLENPELISQSTNRLELAPKAF